ncbi:MAG TPA: hypothetical protein VLF87_02495, partial [Patescibacteria group bacterium]|nr:hypothetical protein [Patescibacteria group bacterium]
MTNTFENGMETPLDPHVAIAEFLDASAERRQQFQANIQEFGEVATRGYGGMVAALMTEELNAGVQSVNVILEQIGGTPVAFSNVLDGRVMKGRVISCLQYNSESNAWMFEFVPLIPKPKPAG